MLSPVSVSKESADNGGWGSPCLGMWWISELLSLKTVQSGKLFEFSFPRGIDPNNWQLTWAHTKICCLIGCSPWNIKTVENFYYKPERFVVVYHIIDGCCGECGNKEVKGGSSSGHIGHKVTPSVSVIKRTGTGAVILVDKSVVTSLIGGLHYWAQLPRG